MDILDELMAWLETERKFYKDGSLTSISESVIGENIITGVQKKIETLRRETMGE